MAYHLRGLPAPLTAIALVCGMLAGMRLSGLHERIHAAQPKVHSMSAGRPAVIRNSYAQRDKGDDALPVAPLSDGALFIAPALPGPCPEGPPCFDRAAVIEELIVGGGGQGDCYQMTKLELAGNHVTGRIEIRSDTGASTGCV